MAEASFIVRQATSADLRIVSQMFDGYRVFYEQKSDLQSAERFISERLKGGDSTIFMAINDAGEGLGFTQLYPLFSSVRMKKIWLLNDLYVAPEARRKGVGHSLMVHAQNWVKEQGGAGLELATARDNESAMSVYNDLGWSLDTEYHHYSISV